MKQIKLTQGQVALVDDEDFAHLNQWKWFANYNKAIKGFYAIRTDYSSGHRRDLLMHREIMKTPKGLICDHINHNTLDNRKVNLRNASYSENMYNSRGRINSTSGAKGVSWVSRVSRWRAYINYGGRQLHLGYFVNFDDASKAYDEMALKLFGTFAYTNGEDND